MSMSVEMSLGSRVRCSRSVIGARVVVVTALNRIDSELSQRYENRMSRIVLGFFDRASGSMALLRWRNIFRKSRFGTKSILNLNGKPRPGSCQPRCISISASWE